MMALRHLAGRHLGLLGQDQGQIGGQVAVLRMFGRLHFEGGQGFKGQPPDCPGPLGTGRDQITNGFLMCIFIHFLTVYVDIP